MKIQFISDLHLETQINKSICYYEKLLIPSAPILVLAGDIGMFEKSEDVINFLNWACNEWDQVVYVIGNHEYYRTTTPVLYKEKYKNADLSLALFRFKKEVAHLTNLNILERGILKLGKIWIAGTTLWSRVDKKRPSLPQYVKQRLNITAEEYLARHKRDKEWLLRVHREASKTGINVVAVTHHCPHLNFIPKNRWTISNSDMYATTIDVQNNSSPGGIKWWIFGHTHFNVDQLKNGIRYITNQCGKERDNCTSKQNMYIIV